jgi:hypothetical protein
MEGLAGGLPQGFLEWQRLPSSASYWVWEICYFPGNPILGFLQRGFTKMPISCCRDTNQFFDDGSMCKASKERH